MPDPTTVVRTYIEMWNETDPERRRKLVARTVTDDARYLDPIMSGDGPDGICEMIASAQQQGTQTLTILLALSSTARAFMVAAPKVVGIQA